MFSFFPIFSFHPCNDYVESEQGIFEQVLHGDLDFTSEPWPSISESAKDLVRKMLVRDPRRRLTAHDVLCESSIVLFCFVFDQLIQMWELCD